MRFNYRGDLLVKRGCIKKSWLNIYIYIYISFGNFNNRFLVGVEFKFLKLSENFLSKLNLNKV